MKTIECQTKRGNAIDRRDKAFETIRNERRENEQVRVRGEYTAYT